MVSTDHNHQSETVADMKKGNLQGVTGTLTSRSIRSFVIRNGRLTEAQQDAIDNILPVLGIPFASSCVNFDEYFERTAPLWLEIGFGNGDALLHLAEQHPHVNVIGVEVHAPGVGHLLNGIEQQQLSNLRVIRHDAVEVLETMLPPESIDRALVLFPDPWPKKRHSSRRIVQPDTLQLFASRLAPGGSLRMATDWQPYAHWMLECGNAEASLINAATDGGFAERPAERPVTRFERRGLRLGHGVWDLWYKKAPG